MSLRGRILRNSGLTFFFKEMDVCGKLICTENCSDLRGLKSCLTFPLLATAEDWIGFHYTCISIKNWIDRWIMQFESFHWLSHHGIFTG